MMKTIRLQGIGLKNAIEAKNIIVGDTIIHNCGYTSTVISIYPSKSGKTINDTLRSDESGKFFERKTTPNRLFAIKRVN